MWFVLHSSEVIHTPKSRLTRARTLFFGFLPVVSSGAYPEDEAYFLECLLLFVKDTLLQNPESNNKDLVNEFLASRQQQLTEAKLSLFVHNIDVIGHWPAERST